MSFNERQPDKINISKVKTHLDQPAGGVLDSGAKLPADPVEANKDEDLEVYFLLS